MLTSRRGFTNLVLAGCLGSARAARAHTSFEAELTCPVDRTKLKVRVTASYTTFSQLRDFAHEGAIGDLYASYVHSCPRCYFAGYQDEFSTPVSSATQAWQLGPGRKRWGNQKLTAAQECDAAADRYVFEHRPPREIAQLHLIASYLLRGLKGDLEVSRRRHQQATSLYLLSALAADQIPVDDRGGTMYLIADLERRIGNFEQALVHYDLALKEANNPAGLLTWIKEQRALAAKHDDDNSI